jgi:hypothetical protein
LLFWQLNIPGAVAFVAVVNGVMVVVEPIVVVVWWWCGGGGGPGGDVVAEDRNVDVDVINRIT